MLTDIFSVPDGKSGEHRTVLVLERITHLPNEGDALLIDDFEVVVKHVDRQRTRNCLTGGKLAGLGSIMVLVDMPSNKIRHLTQSRDRRIVMWKPASNIPWHFEISDLPEFIRLNDGWNAEPNAPEPHTALDGTTLILNMRPNPYLYQSFRNVETIQVGFADCSKYRFTSINDEGWYRGQCRFSGLAPEWGEFYEVTGDTRDELEPTAWVEAGGDGTRHFHFYLRDETLEVKALNWSMSSVGEE